MIEPLLGLSWERRDEEEEMDWVCPTDGLVLLGFF